MTKANNDWREERMSKIRTLIMSADPDIVEEQKYKMPSNPAGIPVWYRDGMICTGETYKNHLRLTFSKGVELRQHHDPKGLFNRHSAIVIQQDDNIDEKAFQELIHSAVKVNQKKK